MSLSRTTSFLAVARGISALLVFIATAVFTRLVTEAALGEYFLFEASIWMLSLISDLGLRDAIEKRMSENEAPAAVLSTGLLIKIPIVGLATVTIIQMEPFFQTYLPRVLIGYLAIGVILHEAAFTVLTILSGEHNPSKRAPLRIAQYITWILVGLGLVRAGLGIEGLAIGWLAGYSVIILFGSIIIQTRPVRPDLGRVRSLTRFGLLTSVGTMGSLSFKWADVLLLGFFINSSAVAYYEVAWRVSTLALLLPTAMRVAYIPEISKLYAEQDPAQIQTLLSNSVFLTLLIPIPLTVGAGLLGGDVLAVFFGERYRTGGLILVILAARQAPAALAKVFGPSIEAINRPGTASKVVAVCVFLNIGLNVLFIPIWGAIGAAVATTLSTTLQISVFYYLLHRIVGLQLSALQTSYPILIAALLMGMLVQVLVATVSLELPAKTLFLIGVGACTFVVTLTAHPESRSRLKSGLR
ncbi:hypothetical protein DJ68_09440 [Halorubrum sp. C3]|nr:hypothetical protein DJ68_09440 [Halorubrum sp. C3]